MGLTVAVTGPTGDIGKPLLRALDASPAVDRVLGMARRPFDPSTFGWSKVEYRRGDVLDRGAVDEFVRGADVVVHLAFLILGELEESRRINLEGSRNVFEATVAAGAQRLVYASSVAAYGFHEDTPSPIDEDVPPIGTDAHYYSAQKAELERTLDEVVTGSATRPYVLRPCIVAGPEATIMLEFLQYPSLKQKVPAPVMRLLEAMPLLKPVLPDPGVPFQLVHHDDVAQAIVAAVRGEGAPGVYNIAGGGSITMTDIAEQLGWYALRVPELFVEGAAGLVNRLPFLPAEAQWLNAFREPVLMSTDKARRELGWEPEYDTRSTLRETVDAARLEGVL